MILNDDPKQTSSSNKLVATTKSIDVVGDESLAATDNESLATTDSDI